MKILAIETSCDETSAAVVADGRKVLSNVVSSQIDIHSQYGGVVPEVAARAHTESIIPVVHKALSLAKVNWNDIDSLAVVEGAGLLPSLLTGIATAKSLALAKQKPLIPVNHIVGHIYANWIGRDEGDIAFPVLALVVSGGHTDLHLMKDHLEFTRLGGTLDDAAGEAFDKVAKLLGLGYPGGPIVSERAEQGNPEAFDFPRGMIGEENYNFSFSGLKTAVIYKVHQLRKKNSLTKQQINDICASFQQAVIDVLVTKTIRAAREYKVKSIILAGGVAANKLLRQTMKEKIATELSQVSYYQPDLKECLDNAAMVGVAAFYSDQGNIKSAEWSLAEARPSLRI